MAFDYKANLWINYPGSNQEDNIELKIKKILTENGIPVEGISVFRGWMGSDIMPSR